MKTIISFLLALATLAGAAELAIPKSIPAKTSAAVVLEFPASFAAGTVTLSTSNTVAAGSVQLRVEGLQYSRTGPYPVAAFTVTNSTAVFLKQDVGFAESLRVTVSNAGKTALSGCALTFTPQ